MDEEDTIYMYIHTHTHTHTHTHRGVLLSPKKNEINPFTGTWVGPRDRHTVFSKSDRERQIPCGVTYMWNLKYDANELIYGTDSETQRIGLWS